MADARPPVSAPAFWERLYAAGEDRWDLGEPAPALAAWLDAGGAFAPGNRDDRVASGMARIAVPGAGRGHDARVLARSGYRVWGFDFASAAVDEARRLAERERLPVTFEQRDVFGLAREYEGFFDGVWEYTCFCAIDPERREEYADVVRALLRPGGRLVACFFPLRDGGGGPPFPVARDEIDRVFGARFRVLSAAPSARSPGERRGLEWLVVAERA